MVIIILQHNKELIDIVTDTFDRIEKAESQMNQKTKEHFQKHYEKPMISIHSYFRLFNREADAKLKHGNLKLIQNQCEKYNLQFDKTTIYTRNHVKHQQKDPSKLYVDNKSNLIAEIKEDTDPMDQYVLKTFQPQSSEIHGEMTYTEFIAFINNL